MGFMTGQKIYDNFTNGTGPQGLSASAAMVRQLAEEYHGEGDAIRQLTAKMESVWQGEAAGAAQRGAGPLATEHELAAPHLGTAQDLNGRQAGSFVDARNAVKPVPPQPIAPDPWAAVNSPGDVVTYRRQVAEFSAANQHNVDVMTGYTAASTFNAKGMPQSYGAIAGDQAGITVGTTTSTPNSGPPRSGPKPDDAPRPTDRGIVEPFSGGPTAVAPPSTTSGPSSSLGATPRDGGSRAPQQTTPGAFTPTPGDPVGPVPPGSGRGVGSGPPSGGPTGGLAPGTGFPPVGGGPYDGSGGRGPTTGLGGRGLSSAGPGAGEDGRGPGGRVGGGDPRGSEVRGPGGRGVSGEPHGPGGRVGAGGMGGEPYGGARGGAGGQGGVPLGGGGRGRDEDDLERYAPEFLQEDDPEALFGTDEMTAPPVIGEEFDPTGTSTAG
jgi:hypothetical protein